MEEVEPELSVEEENEQKEEVKKPKQKFKLKNTVFKITEMLKIQGSGDT